MLSSWEGSDSAEGRAGTAPLLVAIPSSLTSHGWRRAEHRRASKGRVWGPVTSEPASALAMAQVVREQVRAKTHAGQAVVESYVSLGTEQLLEPS
jgi:hypothetical protein